MRRTNTRRETTDRARPRAAGGNFFSQKPVRRAALISPWGVGAMVDFPGDESLMTAGLDAWPKALEECPADWKVVEERLQQRLGVDHFRLPPDYRQPAPGVQLALERVPFVRFPQWHYCPRCGNLRKLALFSGQQKCDAPKWGDGLACDELTEHRRPRLLPVRFVAICRNEGHIQDFPFLDWVHSRIPAQANCINEMRLRAGRSAAGLSGIKLQCLCGAHATMGGAFAEGALDKITSCCGQRPWLGEMIEGPEHSRPQGCGASLRVVQRGASNTYFPHIASSIYLPLWGENARRPVVEALEDAKTWKYIKGELVDGKVNLKNCESVCALSWRDLDPEELHNAAQQRLDGTEKISDEAAKLIATDRYSEEEKFRYDEYQAMKTGKTIQPGLEMSRYSGDEYQEPVKGFFNSITLVRKLRETRVLYGFSRYLPDDGRSPDAQIDELHLDPVLNWLPAIVTRGEGIFFEVDDNALSVWLEREKAVKRASSLTATMNRVRIGREQPERQVAAKFVMLHTLAHLIINQLAFDCGYGSSSLRERIYCDGAFGERPMNGFLIYTASGDSEGTMGGLVRQGEAGRLEATLARALSKARWCSYDPVCSESQGQGPDNCNRAACHGCTILPETSCEEGNRLLDRVTVVGLPDDLSLGFFEPFLAQISGAA